jgi:hypothetical protein
MDSLMKNKLMEIQVHGFTGDGKSHVCKVIRDALLSEYGPCTRITSESLAEDTNSENKPKKNVIFSIEEYNHGTMGTHDV